MPKRKLALSLFSLLRCSDGEIVFIHADPHPAAPKPWCYLQEYPDNRDRPSPKALVEFNNHEYLLYDDVSTAPASNRYPTTILPKTIKKHGYIENDFIEDFTAIIKKHATSDMAVGTFWAMVDEMDFVDTTEMKRYVAKTADLIASKLSDYNEVPGSMPKLVPYLHPIAVAPSLSDCETIVINCCLVSRCEVL